MGKRSKDRRDVYYRLAKEEGFRARSAYKLMELDEEYDLFPPRVRNVVDLCAAPGSWSQVIAREMRGRENAKVVAVDLQEVAPIRGVIIVKGDITRRSTAEEVVSKFAPGEKAQLVVSDGAPDVTGLHDLDEFIQSQLLLSALNLAAALLEPGGTFVAKIFRGKDVSLLLARFELFFDRVTIAKPQSSRNASLEAFVVCEGFVPPVAEKGAGGETSGATAAVAQIGEEAVLSYSASGEPMLGPRRTVVDFVACGDLNGLDSNMAYDDEAFEAIRRGKRGELNNNDDDDVGEEDYCRQGNRVLTTNNKDY